MDRPGVVTVAGQLVPGAVSQHMGMDLKRQRGFLSGVEQLHAVPAYEMRFFSLAIDILPLLPSHVTPRNGVTVTRNVTRNRPRLHVTLRVML